MRCAESDWCVRILMHTVCVCVCVCVGGHRDMSTLNTYLHNTHAGIGPCFVGIGVAKLAIRRTYGVRLKHFKIGAVRTLGADA